MKRILTIVLAISLLAGCSAQTGGKDQAPMGRYIEEDGAALGNLSRVFDLRLAQDGGVTFYGGSTGEDGASLIQRYTVPKDGVAAQTASEPWLADILSKGNYIDYLTSDGDKTAYALGTDADGGDVLFRTTDGGAAYEQLTPSDWERREAAEDVDKGVVVEETSQSVKAGTAVSAGGSFSVASFSSSGDRYVSGVYALAEGGFLIAYNDQGACSYNAAGQKVAEFPGLAARFGTAVYENQLLVRNQDGNELWLYDLDKTERIGTYTYDNLSFSTLAGLDADGLFVGDASGICRQSVGGSLWEKLVDGDLTSLVMPESELLSLVGDGAGGFWAVLREGEASRMARYYYSAETPTNPDTELTIFALADNPTVRQTIGEFQRRNPNVRVNFRVAQTDGAAATTEDIIRALNTEILSGKAPDLLVLDGLSVDAYIEKGVLLDLSDMVAELVYSQGLLENLMNAYAKDGTVYGVPARFTLPVMMGETEAVEPVDSLLSLLEQVNAHQGGEPPLLRSPSDLWGENGMLLDYYSACVNDWSSGRTVDRGGLEQYFATVLALNNTMREHTPQIGDSSMAVTVVAAVSGGAGFEALSMGPKELKNGFARLHIQELSGMMNLNNIISNLGGGAYQLDTLFGGSSYTPVGGVGIVASGKQQELAKSFVELMLSDTVQSKYLYDGFPVNGSSLDAMTAEQLEGADDMGFTALCRKLDTPILVDSVIKAAVQEQTEGLLDGSLTPAQAAENVVKATELYRAE